MKGLQCADTDVVNTPFSTPATAGTVGAIAEERGTAASRNNDPGSRHLKRAGFGLLSLVLVGAVLIAVTSTLEALEERRAAAAAADLHMASMTLAHADVLTSYGAEPELSEVDASVEVLTGNPDLALHSLPPDDAAAARELLGELAEHGRSLLEPGDREVVTHDHQPLHVLLDRSSQNAESNAARSEQLAALAVFGAVVALCFGAWLLIRTRYRGAKQEARSEAELHAGRRLESMLNNSPEIFLVVDQAGDITYRSASADRLLKTEASTSEDIVRLGGSSERDELQTHLGCSDAGGASAVFELTGIDGEAGWYELRVSDLTDDDLVHGHLITARDITNEVRLREDLRQLANTDVLTGLPNRRTLQAAFDNASNKVRDSGDAMALMTLDIDGFKSVNDTLGHLAGDELLIGVARRLEAAIGPDDVMLRLGGDEFALIIPSVSSELAAEQAAQHLLDRLDEPFRFGDRVQRIRTSIGVAVTTDPVDVDILLGEADTAMYQAKHEGGDAVMMYEPALDSATSRAKLITQALRDADYDFELSVVYQPIVTADAAEVVGIEALLRWNSPVLGIVDPDEFIPIAEACGEICVVGRWVLDTVCSQMADWVRTGIGPNIAVSVNVSPRQLAAADFVSGVLATAERWDISPERLVVEVTESTALDHTGLAISRLEQLRQAGLRISIDDFGSGYSNLGQLLRVPFDVIKIDRSLLITLTRMREQAGDDPSAPCAIMEAIVAIAGVLDAPVVCEGVETELQRTSLQASGVSYIQGYLTGRPVGADAISPRLWATALADARS